MTSDYKPKFDVTPELNAKDTPFYQELIGELRQVIEIGRIDIIAL